MILLYFNFYSFFNMQLAYGMEFVFQLDGVEAMWILVEVSIQYSDGFEEYTR